MKKYEFTGECKVYFGVTLRRIKSLIDFSDVKKGELGGFIEKEENLSHNCKLNTMKKPTDVCSVSRQAEKYG